MKTTSRKSGFSLVELLTVIAIIAILAAIIFPVMNTVKERAKENDCMSRLHQIQLALNLYKTDNRKYPPLLCAVRYASGTSDPVLFENAKGDYLYAEYVKTIKMFHCPSSKVTNTTDLATYPAVPYNTGEEPAMVTVYAYDSYDCLVKGIADPDTHVYPIAEQHYAIDWAPSVKYLKGEEGGTPPAMDPAAGSDTAQAAQYDYARQLKFKNPPGDTVVTWCGYHEGGDLSGKALVVFLDGSVSNYPANNMEAYKWRIREKKE